MDSGRNDPNLIFGVARKPLLGSLPQATGALQVSRVECEGTRDPGAARLYLAWLPPRPRLFPQPPSLGRVAARRPCECGREGTRETYFPRLVHLQGSLAAQAKTQRRHKECSDPKAWAPTHPARRAAAFHTQELLRLRDRQPEEGGAWRPGWSQGRGFESRL